MKEYIERAAAMEAILGLTIVDPAVAQYANAVCYHLQNLPAADVAEVRHGRWVGIEYDGYADGFPVYDLWECSECGEEVRGEDVPATCPWCHSCGSCMDKEDKIG